MIKGAPRGKLGGQVLTGEERRRSRRVMIRIPIVLKFMVTGKAVTANGFTESVNDHGAMVQCVRTFATDTTLEVQNERTGEKMSCRVTRAPVENNSGYLIPLEFAAASPAFWRISFPPSDWKPSEE